MTMELRPRARRSILIAACGLLGLASCSPTVPAAAIGAGGARATGGAANDAGAGGSSGTGGVSPAGGTPGGQAGAAGGVGGVTADECPEMPVPHRNAGTTVAFPLAPFFENKPFLFGEANRRASGGFVTPLNVRFYVSGVALTRPNGDLVPVDLVAANGVLEPYGVHLFNAEDPASVTLRVLAPAGAYTGVTFLLGLDGACNSRRADSSKAPLSATSQMTWEHLAGYLFLRYEGRFDPPSSGSIPDGGGDGPSDLGPPPAVHMGGRPMLPLAPRIKVEGTVTVAGAEAVAKTIRLSMDELFRGATTEVDLTGFIGFPGEEVTAGERLRRNAPGLHLFSFEP